MAKSPLTRLTPRDREVLELIAQGKTNAEIASALSIRFDTARWHVSEVLSKLGVASREEAAAVFRAERQPRSRLRRSFAGIPALLAVGSAATAAVVGVVLLVSFAMGNDDPAGSVQPLVAYTEHDAYSGPIAGLLLEQEPAPVRVVNAQTHDEMEFGPPSHYLAVRWAPGSERIFALAAESDEGADHRFIPMLLEYPSGTVQRLDFEQTHGPASRYDMAWWSPGGSLMILRWGDFFLLCESDGQLIRELDPAAGAGVATGSPVWSPNGEHFGARFGNQTMVFDRSGTLVFALESGEGGGPLFWPVDDQLVVLHSFDETTYSVVDLSSGQPIANAGDEPNVIHEHFAYPDPATRHYWSEFRKLGEDPPPMSPVQATYGRLFMLERDARTGNELRPRKIGIGVADSVFLVDIQIRWAIPSLAGGGIDVVLQP